MTPPLSTQIAVVVSDTLHHTLQEKVQREAALCVETGRSPDRPAIARAIYADLLSTVAEDVLRIFPGATLADIKAGVAAGSQVFAQDLAERRVGGC